MHASKEDLCRCYSNEEASHKYSSKSSLSFFSKGHTYICKQKKEFQKTKDREKKIDQRNGLSKKIFQHLLTLQLNECMILEFFMNLLRLGPQVEYLIFTPFTPKLLTSIHRNQNLIEEMISSLTSISCFG